MATGFNPYGASQGQNFLDLIAHAQLRGKHTKDATKMQMSKMQEEYEKDLEDAKKAALKKQNKNKGLFKGLDFLASAFLGPLGTGIVKGLTSAGRVGDARSGAKKLLSDVDLKRWDKTFLKDSSKAYREQAEDTQMSTGDILRGAIGGGISGYAGSKLLGGGEQSPFQKWREGRQAGKAFKEAESLAFDKFSASPELDVLDPLTGLTSSQKFIQDKLMEKGFENVPSKALGSKTPGLSNLWENLTKQGGITGGMEEVKSAMMLPMLLQQILGDY